jgi:hypothetical protein
MGPCPFHHPEPKEIKEMKYVKLVGLAAIAAMAMMAIGATASAALLEDIPSSGGELASLLSLSGSLCALGALRIWTSQQQFDLNTLLAQSHTTVGITHQCTVNALTIRSHLRRAAFTGRELPTATDDADVDPIAQRNVQPFNPQHERKTQTLIPVMAC